MKKPKSLWHKKINVYIDSENSCKDFIQVVFIPEDRKQVFENFCGEITVDYSPRSTVKSVVCSSWLQPKYRNSGLATQMYFTVGKIFGEISTKQDTTSNMAKRLWHSISKKRKLVVSKDGEYLTLYIKQNKSFFKKYKKIFTTDGLIKLGKI